MRLSGRSAVYKVVWPGLALVRIARVAQGENRNVEEESELRPLPVPRCRVGKQAGRRDVNGFTIRSLQSIM